MMYYNGGGGPKFDMLSEYEKPGGMRGGRVGRFFILGG
jgi:hypothetical protein